MKRLILLFFLFIQLSLLTAQEISGVLKDLEDNMPIEFAQISLLTNDSIPVNSTISESNGKFSITSTKKDNYIVSISSLGYEELSIAVHNLTDKVDLGDIYLKPSYLNLDEVVITADPIIQKVDRQIILPTSTQIKSSDNGITLLRNLQLSRIVINPLSNSISSPDGNSVQFRLNGIEVDQSEIKAIDPNDVIRIEILDSQSIKFQNSGTVINYIIRRKESGGTMSLNTSNTLSKYGFSDNDISLKQNYKDSEFGLIASWNNMRSKWIRENEETFVFPEKKLERKEIGSLTKYNENNLKLILNYNLIKADKYLLNVSYKHRINDTPNQFSDRNSEVYTNEGQNYSLQQHSEAKDGIPALDIYYQLNLKNDQSIILNTIGTYMHSTNKRTYKEFTDNDILTDIYTRIAGDKYSLIAEGMYEKSFKTSKLTGGVRHLQSYVKNKYYNDQTKIVSLNNSESNIYIEYQLRKNKFNYNFTLGGMRLYSSQDDIKKEKFIFRPSIDIFFRATDKLSFTYNGLIAGYSPALSDMNDVDQVMDSLQIYRGNPNLKSVTYYNNRLKSVFKQGRFTANLYLNYRLDNKPIMSQINYIDGKFITSNYNQKKSHRLNTELNLQFEALANYITIDITPGWNRYINKGYEYMHTYTNWYFRASITANYKNWNFYSSVNSRYNNLSGEIINRGERLHLLILGYNKEKWSTSIGVFNLFSKKYSQDSRNISQLNPSYSNIYSRNMGQIFLITFSWRLDYGRKTKSSQRKINNSDSESSVFSGTKRSL